MYFNVSKLDKSAKNDLVKIVAAVIAYQFIAQKLWKLFIITEVISYVLFYVLGVYFVGKFGVEGVVTR